MTSFQPTAIPEVVEVLPRRHGDSRGFFSETYKQSVFAAAGLHRPWVQDNHSYSEQPGTLRGLHLQIPPVAQTKLVRVLSGAIFDVAVDLRKNSASYGQWVGVRLSAEAGNQLFVPAGFGHGFLTLEPNTEVLYKVDAEWSRDHELAIRWNDPDLSIRWPLAGRKALVSDKDAAALAFASFESPF